MWEWGGSGNKTNPTNRFSEARARARQEQEHEGVANK